MGKCAKSTIDLVFIVQILGAQMCTLTPSSAEPAVSTRHCTAMVFNLILFLIEHNIGINSLTSDTYISSASSITLYYMAQSTNLLL